MRKHFFFHGDNDNVQNKCHVCETAPTTCVFHCHTSSRGKKANFWFHSHFQMKLTHHVVSVSPLHLILSLPTLLTATHWLTSFPHSLAFIFHLLASSNFVDKVNIPSMKPWFKKKKIYILMCMDLENRMSQSN